MSMSKYVALLLAAGMTAFATTASYAEDSPHEFSANVALTTDYRFRGISQSNEDPSISGGFDYTHSSGFYVGVWAGSLDFAVPDPDDADIEIDYYGGFSGEIGNGIGWDIGGLYYAYPGSDTGSADYDYFEVYGSLSYDFGNFDIAAGIAYSPDYFFESDDGIYVYGDVGIPLPSGFAISGHVGHQSIDDNAQFGTPDYTNWSIGISKDLSIFSFDLSYLDTNMSSADCFGGGDICDGTVIFSISSSF